MLRRYDGSGLEREWDDWVSRNLTADEQERLTKEHATNRIFGSRLGGFDREIKIKEAGGMIDITHSASRDGSQNLQTASAISSTVASRFMGTVRSACSWILAGSRANAPPST